MMHKMIVANLAHRPLRSLISIVAIALEVTLILLIVGFSLEMLNDSRDRQQGIGATSSFSSRVFESHWDQHCSRPNQGWGNPWETRSCASRAPVIIQMAVQSAGTPELILGHRLASYENMRAQFRYLQGGPFQGPNDALVDDFFASSKHIQVGS